MKDEDIINKFKDKNGKISPSKFKQYCNDEDKKYLKSRFPEFLDYLFSLKRIFYHIETLPKCEYCGKPIFALHQKWCNQKCQMNDPNFIQYRNNKIDKDKRKQKFEKTCLDKYGVANPLSNKEIRKKISNTNIEKYGTPNIGHVKWVREKIKRTFNEKYGCDNPGQVKEFKNKIRQTNISRYGVDCSWKRKEVKEKSKQTFLSRYGVENYVTAKDFLEKSKETCINKYGVDSYSKTKEFKDTIHNKKEKINKKIRNTFLKKYGVEYAVQLPEIKNKIFDTRKKNHTLNSSKIEDELFEYIKHKFPLVKRQYKDKERYPYYCDFYIPELDYFIELQGYYTHNDHPYNKDSIKDQALVEKYKEKYGEKCQAITIWTIKDVDKRNCAKEHNLNFKEIWSLKEGQEFIDKLYCNYENRL